MLGSLQFGYNTGVINAPQKVSATPSQPHTPPPPMLPPTYSGHRLVPATDISWNSTILVGHLAQTLTMISEAGFVYMVLGLPRAPHLSQGRSGGHSQSGGTFPSATEVDRQSQCAESPIVRVLHPHTPSTYSTVQFQIETPSSSGVSMLI